MTIIIVEKPVVDLIKNYLLNLNKKHTLPISCYNYKKTGSLMPSELPPVNKDVKSDIVSFYMQNKKQEMMHVNIFGKNRLNEMLNIEVKYNKIFTQIEQAQNPLETHIIMAANVEETELMVSAFGHLTSSSEIPLFQLKTFFLDTSNITNKFVDGLQEKKQYCNIYNDFVLLPKSALMRNYQATAYINDSYYIKRLRYLASTIEFAKRNTIINFIHDMMKLLNNIFIPLQVFLGFLFISYIFYSRIFRTYLPKELINLNSEQVYFFSFMVLITTILLSISLHNYDKNYDFILENRKKAEILETVVLKTPWYVKYMTIILTYIKNSIFSFYCFLLKHTFFSSFFDAIIRIICNLLYNKDGYYQRIIYVMFVIPQIIISSIFLIDIFYFKQLNYFYNALILYLVPLLLHSFCTMFEEYHDRMTTLWITEYLKESIDKDNIPCLTTTAKAPCSYKDFLVYEQPFIAFIGSVGYFGKNYIIELKKKSLSLIAAQVCFVLGWTSLLTISILIYIKTKT